MAGLPSPTGQDEFGNSQDPNAWKKVAHVDYDVVGWAPDAVINKQYFFNTPAKPLELQSGTIPFQGEGKRFWAQLKATHTMAFTVASGGTPGYYQYRFEETTFVEIMVNGSEYLRVPLSLLTPYTISNESNVVVYIPKRIHFWPMGTPLTVHLAKELKVAIVPPTEAGTMTAAPTGATSPILPGVAGTSNTAHAVFLRVGGQRTRRLA